MKQNIVTLDMEGVLTPEVWINVAQRTGIDGLLRTTRDEPDYDVLMRYRLDLLDKHGITITQIQEVIAELPLLDGCIEFLDALRSEVQLIILSDTFEQFATPFLRQMKWPTVFCHRLVIENDRITDYKLRQPDQKRQAVKALHGLKYNVIAAGDSFNDTTMLSEADHGFLFHAPQNVIEQFPQYSALNTYDELLASIRSCY